MPKSVTSPSLRASLPSRLSVIEAMANTRVAINRQPVLWPPAAKRVRRNTGTSTSRDTVSRLATLTSGIAVGSGNAGVGRTGSPAGVTGSPPE